MSPVSLRLVSAQPDGATRRLHLLMRQRDALGPLFRMAWDNLAGRFEPDELEGWAAGVLTLADVNAGPSCLIAFWEFSRNHPTDEGIAPLIAAAEAAANICRRTGGRRHDRFCRRRTTNAGARSGVVALVACHGRPCATRA